MTNQIGAHMSRNGVAKQWPTRAILSYGGNGLGEQHKDTIVIFRSPGIAERPSDLYTNPAPMADIAKYWYDKQFKPLFVAITATYPDNPIYFVLTNEACGTDEEEVIKHISYERELCKLAKADGFRCGIGKLANGTPQWDSGLWQKHYAPWIVEAWNDYGAIYLRHVYGGDLVNADGSISKAEPYYPYRVMDELQVLQSLGWKGGLFISECGLDGGYGKADWNRFVFQITKFEQALRPYADNVIGFAWWECGATDWGADYTDYLKQMTGYMSENSLPKWEGGTAVTPPDPTEPPTGSTEEKIFVMSQAWAFPVNEVAALQKAALADGYTPSGKERWLQVDGSLWAMQPFYKIGSTNKKRSYFCLVNAWDNVEWTDGTTTPEPPPVITPPPTGEPVNITAYVFGIDRRQFDLDYGTGTQTTMISYADDAKESMLYIKGGNGEYERLFIDMYNGIPWIFRADDTSESATRMYAHYESKDGKLGAPWIPCSPEVGKWYETTKWVQHYNKADCAKLNGGQVVDKIRLISKPYNRTYSTGKTLQVVTLEWASGEQYDFSGGNVGFRDATRNFQFMGWLEGRVPLVAKKYPCFGW